MWEDTSLLVELEEGESCVTKWNGLCWSVQTLSVKRLPVFFTRNVMSDYGSEVMAEVLAERALVRPQIIPLVPLTNQYRHQDHMDLKDYKSKVRLLMNV